jgi:aerobic-type carbon monoxide dehydrogenase small subunit (CoxS/CutS family)
MSKPITFSLNGQSRTVATDPQRSLLDVLREDLGLTGTKYGCGEGQCRACTVLLDGKSVASCITLVADAEGKAILTIEGVAKGDTLHPVQEAFLAEAGFQCGYCTPGMILEIVGALKEKPTASVQDLLPKLQKHVCRCCSYPNILNAVRRVTAPVAAAKGS